MGGGRGGDSPPPKKLGIQNSGKRCYKTRAASGQNMKFNLKLPDLCPTFPILAQTITDTSLNRSQFLPESFPILARIVNVSCLNISTHNEKYPQTPSPRTATHSRGDKGMFHAAGVVSFQNSGRFQNLGKTFCPTPPPNWDSPVRL